MDRYERLDRIGEGTYATVYKARDRQTGQVVALKEIILNQEEGAPSTALREIAFLRELNHPNVVKLLEVIHGEELLVLVFEHMELDLKQYLDEHRLSNTTLQPVTIKKMFWQLLQACHYCHHHRILHRDLKPQNLLVDRASGRLKLADFGLARGFGIPVQGYSHEVVTLWYRAPEVLLGSTQYTCSIDSWSLGCILAEMHLGIPLFAGKNTQDQLVKIFKLLGTPTNETWPHLLQQPGATLPPWVTNFHEEPVGLKSILSDERAVDLISKLLDYRPTFRLTAEQAMSHSFFQ